ncbi:MAG: hypothetical protein QXS79_06625 [Candidatus Bathyarchaeia archaeon]
MKTLRKVSLNELKSDKADFREYWTRLGDRIIRVIVAAVKDKDGKIS